MESKKLAELLGIKPHSVRYEKIYGGEKIEGVCKIKEIYIHEKYKGFKILEYISVDFEQPENFVKLLDYMTELDYGLQLEKSSITIEGCYCNWDIKKSKTENYISGITEFLENEKSESIDFDVNSAPYWHNIQQQAQQVKWNY
jgi:hypothetical protein